MKNQSTEELLAQIAQLQAQLIDERMSRERAEAEVNAATAEDRSTGRTKKVRVCKNPYERDPDKQKWEVIDVPTFMYHVQLPVGAAGSDGSYISINGERFYHNGDYEVDGATLSTLKAMVGNAWSHEKSLHGANENAYRKQEQPYVRHMVN